MTIRSGSSGEYELEFDKSQCQDNLDIRVHHVINDITFQEEKG
jgi:hypothetical protein